MMAVLWNFGILLSLTSLTLAQDDDTARTADGTCCNARLMDSGGRVVIEPRRPLKVLQGTAYTHIHIPKLCSRDEFWLQLWENVKPLKSNPNDNTEFELRWQIKYTSQTPLPINAFPTGIQIGADWRFGMFSSVKGPDQKYAIGYVDRSDVIDMNAPERSSEVVWRSKEEYPIGHTFSLGDIVKFDTLTWPRIFSTWVTFCSDSNCDEVLYKDEAKGIPGPPGPKGDTGKDGTPGQCDAVHCTIAADLPDTYNQVPERLTELEKDAKDINDNTKELKEMVYRLIGSETPTGLCPSSFRAGTYGVGYCYRAVRTPTDWISASMACRPQQAMLAHIPKSSHETFLFEYISETYTGFAGVGSGNHVEKFWVRGIWSMRSRDWNWYTSTDGRTDPMYYSHFLDGEENETGADRCVALNIDYNQFSTYWTSEPCIAKYYYICETAKECL